jgi:tetratricopeptide (TPR) repeat protein
MMATMETPFAPPASSIRPWMRTAAYRQADEHLRQALHFSHGPDEDLPAAWRHICRALELDPNHASASVFAGEMWLYDYDRIGCGEHAERSGAEAALPYFDRALEVEPLHAEAWGCKAHALCRLERYEEALAAAEAGLKALPHGVDHLWYPEVYPFVDRELSDAMVNALVGLGRRAEGLRVLDDALSRYPGHPYLDGLRAELDEVRAKG